MASNPDSDVMMAALKQIRAVCIMLSDGDRLDPALTADAFWLLGETAARALRTEDAASGEGAS